MELSVVVPTYNSSRFIEELNKRLNISLSKITSDYEIIYVNDGSKDNTWNILKNIKNKNVISINLTKNFGQHNAIMAGLNKSSGNYVITMDDDLQHLPEEMCKLYERIKKEPEIDVIIGKYNNKKHNIIRNLGSYLSQKIAFYTLGVPTNLSLTSFRIIRRNIVLEIIKFNTISPRIGLIIFYITKNIINIPVKHEKRKVGRSGYSLSKLVRNFIDNILNYSSIPLRIATYMGIFFAFISFFLSTYYFISYLIYSSSISGFTTLVLILTFFLGIILVTMGIIGEYLIRIVEASEYRPQFIIREIKDDKK